MRALAVGQKLGGRYRLVAQIGVGATCRVYRAIDELGARGDDFVGTSRPGDLVALKAFFPHAARGTLEGTIRFRREALLLGGLGHPNIVRVLGLGEHAGAPFITMEILDGSLEARLASRLGRELGALGVDESLRLLIDVARGLAFAHARGVVHRDLKPANVLLRDRRGGGVATLADFGIAFLEGALAEDRGRVVGTPGYMAPEQCHVVDAPTDERSDLFSLGVLAYEMLTARRPFSARTLPDYIRSVAGEPPRSPRSLQTAIPPALDAVVLRLLSRNPHARYRSALGVLADLERIVRTPHATFELGLADGGGKLATRGPLVGREQERTALASAWERAMSGQGGTVIVLGDAGIGKTRLVDELAPLVAAKGGLLLRGKSLSIEAHRPFGALVDALRDLAADEDVASLAARLRPMIADLDDALVRAVPELARLVGAGGGAPAPSEQEQLRVREGLVRLLLAIAEVAGPAAICLDGVDWTDDDTRAVVTQLAREATASPLLLVLAGRERATWLGALVAKSRASELFLGPLDDAGAKTVVRAMLSGASHEVAELVATHTAGLAGGNPSLLEEQVRSLVEGGILASTGDGAWSCDASRLAASEPARTVAEAIAARFARLPEDVRRVIAVAAVVGRRVPFATLAAALSGLAPVVLVEALDAAVSASLLVRESSGGYAFSSDRTMGAVYDLLDGSERARLHASLLRGLEDGRARGEDVSPGELLRHAQALGDAERTFRYARASADDARNRHAHLAATTFLELALASVPSDARTAVLLDLAEARLAAGRLGDAVDAAREALADVTTAASRDRMHRVLAAAYFAQGRYDDATRALDDVLRHRGIPIARGRAALVASLARSIASEALEPLRPRAPVAPPIVAAEELVVFDTLGRFTFFTDALRFVETSMLAFRRLGRSSDAGARMWALAAHAVLCFLVGLRKRAELCHAAAAALEAQASPLGRARALPTIALYLQISHDPIAGIAVARRAEEACLRAGDVWSLTACLDMQTSMLLARGDVVAAARAADRLLLLVDELDVRQRRPRAILLSSYLGWVLGRLDGATCASQLDRCAALAHGMGDDLTAAAIAWMDADVALASGHGRRACRRARLGYDLVRRERRLHPDAILAVATLARTLALTGGSSFFERRATARLADQAVAWGDRLPGVRAAGLAARAVVLAASGVSSRVIGPAVSEAEAALNADNDLVRLGALWIDLARVGHGSDDGSRGVALLEAIGAVGVARDGRRLLGLRSSSSVAYVPQVDDPARGRFDTPGATAAPVTGTTQRSGRPAG